MLGQNSDNTSALKHVFSQERFGVWSIFFFFPFPQPIASAIRGRWERREGVPKQVRRTEMKERETTMEAETSSTPGRVRGGLLLKVRGQIYLFPWKLQ